MDYVENIWNSINGFLFSEENFTTPTEQTVAPSNSHPIEFDITLKPVRGGPIIDFIPLDQIEVKQPPEAIKHILDDILGGFAYDTTKLASATNLDEDTTVKITTMDIPEKFGHTFVKVVEDATGKTVEVLQESITEIPEVVRNVANGVSDIFNHPKHNMIVKEKIIDETNYINVYVIAALVLIIIIVISAGGILWCKKNRLKAEKRNQYPVMSVVNHEYMDPQMLKNNCEKLKDIP